MRFPTDLLDIPDDSKAAAEKTIDSAYQELVRENKEAQNYDRDDQPYNEWNCRMNGLANRILKNDRENKELYDAVDKLADQILLEKHHSPIAKQLETWMRANKERWRGN